MKRGAGAAWAAAGFLVPLAVYLRTLHPGLPGPDSGELITVAYTLGIAHPPGYPLYTLIAHAFDRALGVGAVAWRLNLLSALMQAAAACVMGVAVSRLTRQPWAGLAAALALAFARAFWKTALVAEVFPLNDLMAALLWLGFVGVLIDAGLVDPPPASARPWPAFLMLTVTAAIPAHHHSLLVLALPLDLVALALVTGRPSRVRRLRGYRMPYAPSRAHASTALALALVAIAPLAYLPLAATRHPAMAWGEAATARGFMRLLMRSEYGTLSLGAMGGLEAHGANHAWAYLRALPAELTWWNAALGALGLASLVAAARRGRASSAWTAARPLLAAVIGAAALQWLFLSRVNLPLDRPYYRGVVERFHPLPDVTVALLIGLGAARAVARVPRAARGAAGAVLVAGAALVPIVVHGRSVDQSGNTFNEDLGRNVLAPLPPGAVLFYLGDMFAGDLQYLTLVERERPDVALVDQALLARPWYVRSLRRRYPDLLPVFSRDPGHDAYSRDSASANARWIEHLEGRRPVAFLGQVERSYAARYEMVEQGLVLVPYRIGRSPAAERRARDGLAVLAECRLDSYFRRQDPTGAEADARWRVSRMVSRLCLELCDASAAPIRRADTPGLATLGAFLDRYVALDHVDDPEVLRASGMLHAFHPEFRDAARAASDLSRYLAVAPPGAAADGARRLLADLERRSP